MIDIKTIIRLDVVDLSNSGSTKPLQKMSKTLTTYTTIEGHDMHMTKSKKIKTTENST